MIEQCSHTLNAEGNSVLLSAETKNDLMNVSVVKQYAAKCYRTLLVAYCDYEDSEWKNLKSQYNNFEKEVD